MLKPGKKIGEGHFRECFEVEGDPGLCIKKLRPDLGVLQKLHLFLLNRDVNKEEFLTYSSLPVELRPYFSPVVDLKEDHLVAGRPVDFDGNPSRSLSEYGKVRNEYFWKDIDIIVSLFRKYDIWFFDAFRLGENVFVQKLTDKEWKPVIVDYKRLGWKSYPVQLNLLFNSERKKKFFRRLNRFEESFRAGSPRI